MNGFVGNSDVPLGLGMALAQNMSAMERFSMMNDAQRRLVIERAGAASSRGDMRSLVENIAEGKLPGSM